MFTGTYPIGTAFHSFKKAQFQLLDPDPDPDWRFESGSTWIRIRNTGYYTAKDPDLDPTIFLMNPGNESPSDPDP